MPQNKDGRKWITVGKLLELLSDPRLRPEDELSPNIVANLALFRSGQQIGVIYVGLDQLVLFENPDGG